MKCRVIFVILAILCAVTSVDARGKVKKKSGQEVQRQQPDSKYQKLFKGKACETVKGMITIHKTDGKVYFEFPLALLGREMLLGSTVSEITDNRFAIVGEKPYDPLHIVFTRVDSLVSLRLVSSGFVSGDKNIAERIKESTVPAILRNFEVKAYNPDSTAVVIDMTGYLVEDIDALGPFSRYAPITGYGRAWIEKEFKASDSRIAKVKAFSDNVSVQSSMVYSVNVRDDRYYYVYKQPFTAVMTRS